MERGWVGGERAEDGEVTLLGRFLEKLFLGPAWVVAEDSREAAGLKDPRPAYVNFTSTSGCWVTYLSLFLF